MVCKTERGWSLVRLEKQQEKTLLEGLPRSYKSEWTFINLISDREMLTQQKHVSKIGICMMIQCVTFIKQKTSEMRASRFPAINAFTQSSGRKWQLL